MILPKPWHVVPHDSSGKFHICGPTDMESVVYYLMINTRQLAGETLPFTPALKDPLEFLEDLGSIITGACG